MNPIWRVNINNIVIFPTWKDKIADTASIAKQYEASSTTCLLFAGQGKASHYFTDHYHE